jgi:hypothetical protein
MNSRVKLAVGAALLSVASMSAFATNVTPPSSGPTPVPGLAPNGGLVVEVWDTTTGTSLSEWLGGDISTFGLPSATPAAGEVLDYGILGGSTVFNSLFSSAEVTAGDVKFNVEASNGASSPTIDTTLATTGTIRGSAVASNSSGQVTGIASVMNAAAGCNNANPCTATSTSAPGYNVAHLGQTAIGAATTNGYAGGSAVDFYQITDTGAAASETPVQFANASGAATWSLSSAGDLVFSAPSAVPLPAAVWLFGSGLLGLAGIGRRKSQSV